MDSIEEILVSSTELNPAHLNQTLYRFPELSTIEGIIQTHGESQLRLLQVVAKSLNVPLLLGREKLAVDDGILDQGQYELQHLIYTLKALPLGWVQEGNVKSVQIAMVNPADAYAKQVFANYFQAPLNVCLARESEIFEALRYKIAVSPGVVDYMEKPQRLKLPLVYGIADETVRAALHKLFLAALQYGATTIELDFRATMTAAVLCGTQNRTQGFDIPLTPEVLAHALVEHSAVAPAAGPGWQGVLCMQFEGMTVEANIAFLENFRSRRGMDVKTIILSEISINSDLSRFFWAGLQSTAGNNLRQYLSSKPGVYVGVFPTAEATAAAFTVFAKSFKDFQSAPNLKALVENQALLAKARFTRVFVPMKGSDLQNALGQLQALPEPVRFAISGVFTYSQAPRSCVFCKVPCTPAPDAQQTLTRLACQTPPQLQYPCGCPVCGQTGQLGKASIAAFLPGDSSAGRKLKHAEAPQAVAQEMQREGIADTAHLWGREAAQGQMSCELLLRSVFGQTQIAEQQTRARGKTVEKNQVSSDGAPLAESPLYIKAKTGKDFKDFHSVVLKLGADVMEERAALLAEERAQQGPARPVPAPQAAAAPPPKDPNSVSGHKFHSVVLMPGDNLLGAREQLLAEERAKAFKEVAPPSAKKPNASGHKYHSMVLSLDDEAAAMRKKLLEEE